MPNPKLKLDYLAGWDACMEAVQRELGLTSQAYNEEIAYALQCLLERVKVLRREVSDAKHKYKRRNL